MSFARFSPIIYLMIGVNTVILAMDYDSASPAYRQTLDQANTVLMYLFLGEAGLKIAALGPRTYVKARVPLF